MQVSSPVKHLMLHDVTTSFFGLCWDGILKWWTLNKKKGGGEGVKFSEFAFCRGVICHSKWTIEFRCLPEPKVAGRQEYYVANLNECLSSLACYKYESSNSLEDVSKLVLMRDVVFGVRCTNIRSISDTMLADKILLLSIWKSVFLFWAILLSLSII